MPGLAGSSNWDDRPMTMTRKEMLAAADAILTANPPEKRTAARIRYRGGRPALTWMKKHNATGAAALWLVARERLPQAANDNLPIEAGLNVDRSRKDGRSRGKNPIPRSLDAYLALPAIQPRMGDAEPEPAPRPWWAGREDAAWREQASPRYAAGFQRGSSYSLRWF